MAIRSVGFALKTDGKAQVKNDFAEVGKAGKDAMNDVATAAEDAAERGAAAAETFATRQAAALKRQANAAKLAAAGADARAAVDQSLGAQGNVGQFATVNFDRSSGAARQSAAAIEAELKAQEDRAAALAKVRAALDPLAAAQARYDAELSLYDGLLGRTGLSEEEHAALVALSARRLNEAKQALEGHSNALGLNRMQFVVGASAAHRFVDSILAGTSPMRAFMMQAGDVATVLQSDDGGVAGGLAKVRALVNPTTVGIAGLTAILLAGTAAWYGYTSATDKFAALAQGAGAVIGATGAGLEANAEAAAKAGNMSVSSARDIETSYVQLGGIGNDVLGGLTAITGKFAAATGTDAKAAVQTLGAAFQDPIKGAGELTARYGFLSQAQIDHIQKVIEQNDLYGAQQALLRDLQGPLDGAADHVNILAWAWRAVKNAADDAWTSMGKAIDRALGGGTTAEHLADLQAERASMAGSNLGVGVLAGLDKQIADAKAQLQKEQAAGNDKAAHAKAVAAMGYVDQATGDNGVDKLKDGQGAINAMLADGGKAAGLMGDRLARARTAQDEYTHAVSTYLPEGEKAVRLAQLDAQLAATKDPAKKAALATERSEIEQRGKLVTATQAQAIATAAGDKARAEATGHGDKHAATLAREAASMEVSARAALDVADAYLKSSAAGMQADAVRKASTDATKKGIDVEAQARRQLDLQVAEGAANGAKAVAALRDETTARAAVNDNVATGKVSIDDMNRALQDQSVLQPLLTLQANAHGEALDKLVAVIRTYKQVLADAHVEESRSQAAQSIDALKKRVQDARLQTQFAGDTSGAYERARAMLAAGREIDKNHYNADQVVGLVDATDAATNADLGAAHAGSAAQSLKAEQDKLAVINAQTAALGKSTDEQDRIVNRLQLQRAARGGGEEGQGALRALQEWARADRWRHRHRRRSRRPVYRPAQHHDQRPARRHRRGRSRARGAGAAGGGDRTRPGRDRHYPRE